MLLFSDKAENGKSSMHPTSQGVVEVFLNTDIAKARAKQNAKKRIPKKPKVSTEL